MKCKSAVVACIIAVLLLSCAGSTPEEQAAAAAKEYYDQLLRGDEEAFLNGKAGADSLPDDYRRELLAVYQHHLAKMQREHGGISEVRISNARSDTTLHLTHAFLLLCFGDSTREEITVPMVECDGIWMMK